MAECSVDEVDRLLDQVSEQRREQALRYTHLYGQYCCLKSYEILLEMLKEYGYSIEKPEFVYGEYGKPQIEGGPYFSISHCKGGIAVALHDAPIGIDIEVVREFKPELMRKTMNKVEQASILSSTNPALEFIRYWTRKEAFLKMKGTGIISNLQETLLESGSVSFTQIENLNKGYVVCVGVEKQYVKS
jgi:4'-phosphopantetheinyl transferase